MLQPAAPAAPPLHQPRRRLAREEDPPSAVSRPQDEREADVRAIRRMLQTAGVRNAEIHAARLVEYRDLEWAPEYSPASPHHQGSASEARNQMGLLRERLAEVQHRLGERSVRGLMDGPRAGNLDARWAVAVRRAHPERFEQLDRDVRAARQNLAAAVQRGDDAATLSGFRTAVDITTHQVRRAELALRSGQRWELFKAAHEAAPRLLAELEEREKAILPAEAASLEGAIKASDLSAPIREMAPEPQMEDAPAFRL